TLLPACPAFNVVIEVFAEQAEPAHDRRAGHVDQSAVAFAAIEVDDLLKLSEERHVSFALLDALDHRPEHRGLHAACRTLAAAFAGKKLRDAKDLFNHAGSFR